MNAKLRRNVIGYSALFVIAGILVYWYWNLNWQTKEVSIGPGPEARQNPYLALQFLLQSKGKETAFQIGYSGLKQTQLSGENLGENDTLVLTNTYKALHQTQIQSLTTWVKQGGTLILSAYNPHISINSQSQDPLLSQLGLQLAQYESVAAETGLEQEQAEEHPQISENIQEEPNHSHQQQQNAPADNEATEDNNRCHWYDTLPLELPGDSTQLEMTVLRRWVLEKTNDQPRPLAYFSDNQFALVTIPLGSGDIYVFASNIALTNQAVACYDNGYSFWQMTKNSPKIWFASNIESPNLWQKLWSQSAIGCIALILSVVLWFWQQATRFGPLVQVPNDQRRHFIHHIHASASFLKRTAGNKLLIEQLRKDIHRQAVCRHPLFADMNEKEQVEFLHKTSGIPVEDLQQILLQSPSRSSSDFVDYVRRLQQLRKSL